MPALSIDFELNDALMARAVREDCIAVARSLVAPKDLLVVLASSGVFVWALIRDSHWLWWLAGLPAGIVGVLGLGWLVAVLWMPRLAISRLAHLPHRRVQVQASDHGLCFQSATERLEVAWTELQALKRLPSFWLFCLQSGMRIPVPAELVSEQATSLLGARSSTSTHRNTPS